MSRKISKNILKPYCGMQYPPPQGRVYGSSKQCLESGQVRYYGRMNIEDSINQFLIEKKKLANEKAKIRRQDANEKKKEAQNKIKEANEAVKKANEAEKEAKKAENEVTPPKKRGRPSRSKK